MPSLWRITARRPPCAGVSAYLTPTPGSRVWRSWVVIAPPRSLGCRKKPPADARRLLHQHDADGRRREHVDAGEGRELVLVGHRERGIAGSELREDDRELAVGDERRA